MSWAGGRGGKKKNCYLMSLAPLQLVSEGHNTVGRRGYVDPGDTMM